MKLNLNKQILIIILISVMITFLSVLFVNNKLFLELFKDKFHEKINIIGREFSKVASLSIILNRKEILIKRADSLLKDEDIIGVEVINNEKKIIFKKGNFKSYNISFPIKVKKFTSDNLLEAQEKEIVLGKVKLYYTRENIKKLMLKIFLLSVFISLVIALIVFLFAYKLISSNFLKPFTFWITNINNEAKLSDFYNIVKKKSSPEMEKLYRVYLNMLATLRDNYEKLSQQKTLAEIGNFSLTIAHEIKNPLGIIKGAFDIIKKENINKETKLEMINYIEEEIKRIDNLVKDFLLMAKNINLNLKEVDVTDIVKDIVEKYKINFPSIQFNFAYKDKIKAITDKNLIIQILINLIKNSIEANSTSINILVGYNEKYWFIKIMDNGVGIDEKQQKKIFEPFYTTKKDGTGIGLTYVAKAVYKLKGKIEVLSNKTQGTTFIIEFEYELK